MELELPQANKTKIENDILSLKGLRDYTKIKIWLMLISDR